ncbi:MAG: serine/threonine protein kinase [Deltaproteobacteria bacterium]|nr:serine/threonine protein kinase [Deltaproteobacteria bacterium]MBN2673144.1 serine/threonine protein kinase [Deltaproteobacteria bacterium]
MNIVCPNCHESLPVEAGTRIQRCRFCEFEINISSVNTTPGTLYTTALEDLSGRVIGDYRIDQFVGMGGMGVVYRGVHLKTNHEVAVKLLNPQSTGATPSSDVDNEIVQRFKREADALKRLEHPNIVKLLDAGEHDHIHYLVTEYMNGKDLAKVLRTERPSPERITKILVQVCDALQFAHEHGVVHRDIKPANILVTDDVVKVLDFGLAHVAQNTTAGASLTRTDVAMGTFNYLSPEQRINAKLVDARSDIFSLGVVFYELLTGTLPLGRFDPPSRHSTLRKRAVDKIVLRCLESNPDKRYPSAAALKQDIAHTLKSERRFPTVIVAAAAIAMFVFGAAAALAMINDMSPHKPDSDTEAIVFVTPSVQLPRSHAVSAPNIHRDKLKIVADRSRSAFTFQKAKEAEPAIKRIQKSQPRRIQKITAGFDAFRKKPTEKDKILFDKKSDKKRTEKSAALLTDIL